jgi:POLQ-like helicase
LFCGYNPELAASIGLIIYDEGHQFDSGARGVTYELLVTSLKALIPKSAQTVLISAVITNGERINGWLTAGEGILVAGIHPTNRNYSC